ncbi:MAG: LysE family translocator [Candidatus Paceibacteria bacterium]
MQELLALIGVMAALAVGAASPGPSFVLVAREAVSASRANGIAAALGMGIGGMLFASAALLGLQTVLLTVPTVYVALKVLGGLYLCYLGYRIFTGAARPLTAAGADSPCDRPVQRSFWLGFTTQVSNPKTAIVYASVFAAFLPGDVSWALALALLLSVFAVEAGWYAIVAAVLSSTAPRHAYLRYKTAIDRVAGTVMAGLGLRLVSSATKP